MIEHVGNVFKHLLMMFVANILMVDSKLNNQYTRQVQPYLQGLTNFSPMHIVNLVGKRELVS